MVLRERESDRDRERETERESPICRLLRSSAENELCSHRRIAFWRRGTHFLSVYTLIYNSNKHLCKDKLVVIKTKKRHGAQRVSHPRKQIGFQTSDRQNAATENLLSSFFTVGHSRTRGQSEKALKPGKIVFCFSAILGIRKHGCDTGKRGRAQLLWVCHFT